MTRRQCPQRPIAGTGWGRSCWPAPAADSVIAAIRELNAAVEVVDRGSYLRVWCPRRCRVTRAALERHRGAPFKLPVDLESVMSSFKGRLSMSEEEACWDA